MRRFIVPGGLALVLAACLPIPASGDADAIGGRSPDVPVRDLPAADVPVVDLPVVDVPVLDTCVPNCEGRVCGPDGVGGECPPGCLAPLQCDFLGRECVSTGTWPADRPNRWGPAGVVTGAACPSETGDVQATCFDYSGDGKGDNGFRSQCMQLVPDGGGGTSVSVTRLALVLGGFGEVLDATDFRLDALDVIPPAEGSAGAGEYFVPEATYDTATCLPRNAFPGASIVDGHLSAGPTTLRVRIPAAPGASMNLVLVQARVRGEVAPGFGPDGFELSGGVFTAVLTKPAFDAGIAELQAACDAAPPETRPQWCQYVPVLRNSMSMMDLHQEDDGTFSAKSLPDKPGDAISICFTFSLAKARIVGFVPAP